MQQPKLFTLNRSSLLLSLSLLVVMLGGLLKPGAAAPPVSFGAKTDFGTGNASLSVAVADFNGDGKLDLALANAGDDTVSILLGTGTGSFGAKTDFGTSSGPISVAVGDFNGDGRLDLAVANDFDATVSILLGKGTGSFEAKTDFGTGTNPFSVAGATIARERSRRFCQKAHRGVRSRTNERGFRRRYESGLQERRSRSAARQDGASAGFSRTESPAGAPPSLSRVESPPAV